MMPKRLCSQFSLADCGLPANVLRMQEHCHIMFYVFRGVSLSARVRVQDALACLRIPLLFHVGYIGVENLRQ